MNKRNFSGFLEGAEKTACEALRLVVDNFLGRHEASNYTEAVEVILETYTMVGPSKSFETHFVYFYLDLFPTNRVGVIKTNCERFHRDISTIEGSY
jgi:hypothetical protein